ncbi:RNA polymerase sigma factor [Streptomyces sp. WG7]|uniref:RNA polymerase sigma factor n=1 Tax=Streptomyces sp. WG7 TaxID=3417650 RepID=UPI003CF5790E
MTNPAVEPRSGQDPESDQEMEFRKFADAWTGNAVGYCMRRYRLDKQDALEVTNDALALVWAMWRKYESKDHMRRSFFGCLQRLCLDVNKKAERRRRLRERIAREPNFFLMYDRLFAQDPERAYELKEYAEIVHQLPEQHSRSLQMAMQDIPTCERAEIKGIDVGTERTHTSRGRAKARKIREQMEKGVGE